MSRSRIRLRWATALTVLLLALQAPPAQSAESLDQSLQRIALDLSRRMAAGQVKKIAVIEFTDLNGYLSAFGQFIAEELITAFLVGDQRPAFDVVERRELARVLQEQELSESSLFDAQSIAKIGKILGIDALVTGSISDLGTEVRINARAISVETARIFAGASATIPRDDRVVELMRQSAGGGGGPPRAPRRQVQRGDVFFKSDLLHVEVGAIGRSEDGRRVTLSLVFRNLTEEDLYLGLAVESHECTARLVDNQGATVGGRRGTVHVTGLPCLGSWEFEDAKEYAKFGPGADTSVVFAFEIEEEEVFRGDFFSFSAVLLQHRGEEEWGRLTVGIANIELQE